MISFKLYSNRRVGRIVVLSLTNNNTNNVESSFDYRVIALSDELVAISTIKADDNVLLLIFAITGLVFYRISLLSCPLPAMD